MKTKTISTTSIATFSVPHSSVTLSNKVHGEYTFRRAFGITALAILILVGVAGAAPFAYVTSPGIDTGTVYVIDPATNNLTAVVPVGEWPREAAVNPIGTKVYVAKPGIGSNTVCVIDTATNAVDAEVNVGGIYPLGIAVNPTGSRVYVTDRDSTNISVINTVTNSLMIPINVGMNSYDVAVTPDGKKIYVTNSFNNTTSVIDATTNKVIATVPVGDSPCEVAFTPDGNKVYVTNSGSNNVSVIDTATYTVIATVPVGENPYDVEVTPDGTKVYVANSRSNNISVINITTNTVTATVPVGTTPMGFAVTPDGKKAYVTNAESNNVSVIDTATNTVTATVNAGKYTIYHPTGVAIGPSADFNMTDQGTKATSNITEDIGAVEETNLSASEDEKTQEINNSSINDFESENGSSSGEGKSSAVSYIPGFGLLGSFACLYGGWKLRKMGPPGLVLFLLPGSSPIGLTS